MNCITHRHDPILQCLTPGMYGVEPIPYVTLISSAQIWNRLDATGIEGITGVYVEPPQPAVIYIGIESRCYGHARQVAAAVFALGLIHVGKYVIVTDSDVDITDAAKVMAAVANRTQASRDLVVLPGTAGGPLDPSADPETKRRTGGPGSWDRVLIDASWPMDWPPREEWGGLRHPPACQAEPELAEKVREQWHSYGLQHHWPQAVSLPPVYGHPLFGALPSMVQWMQLAYEGRHPPLGFFALALYWGETARTK